ncbi:MULTISPECIES: sigma-70 family RNA polymerase sigma factor [Pseudodesulfovibrio]|uniref:RNA polymerase sigma factor n=1 Tax=Pseudodesulfovibrio aespoeensis (strain ATCC 700646 / DSM 10631 / Aspo-2) TaxID=643562 RepID=E6VR41_PSEA9|nr:MULTISPECIES: RNA polymerase factor sigma-32 [Pseudodesulfovibrio]ADU64125.1 RNA polymerase sigma factor, sigma-70 family [Pseudodesulfovibrio aespoeensis Aspo-2]MCG2732276.1 RNA polymerase factor sigma-32 [Pseudodesulfovibrio aespoeensis]
MTPASKTSAPEPDIVDSDFDETGATGPNPYDPSRKPLDDDPDVEDLDDQDDVNVDDPDETDLEEPGFDDPGFDVALDDSLGDPLSGTALPARLDPPESRLPAFVVASSKEVRVRDPLQLYLKEIARFPLLDPEEEYALAKRVQDENDQDAAFKLVSSHLRLVVRIAMDFQRRWMQNALDLIQEGNVGLLKAVTKFDPEKGIKFSYYAAFWVKAYILKYIMDNWRMVKVGTTQTQRKLFYNLNKERQRLQAMGFDPTTEALSKSLGVSEAEIDEMDQRLSRNDMSLNAPLGEDSDATRMDFLPSLGPGIEESLASDQIVELLLENLKAIRPTLNDKELAILDHRLLSDDPMTLREIGERFEVTRERVRQIEARLIAKIREHMTEKIKGFSKDWVIEHD